ncbi:hypothetical protein DRO97_09745 [Archaeoglobales archaeon]|nr:MAG: hypothetical protein DRO97_09745 [Archaeoglobales archaeon]
MKFAKRNQIPLRNLKVKDGYVYINMLVSNEFLNEAREYAERMTDEIGGWAEVHKSIVQWYKFSR